MLDHLSKSTRAILRGPSIAVAMLICLLSGKPLLANDFLSAGEVATISGGTVASLWIGHKMRSLDTNRTPLIAGPLPLETSIQRFLGGEFRPGKSNFLDDKIGSAYTPVAASVLLTVANLAYPQTDREKETMQDLFLFFSGIAATKGITGIFKGLVSRPRPYRTLVTVNQVAARGFRIDRSSFFSGHTSSAFFSAAFLNLRLRSIMRAELTAGEYRDWRWASPTLLFGWASFVGLSRIHAYKHYLSDVLAGALVGYLMAELFYSFGDDGSQWDSGHDDHQTLMRLHLSF